MIKGKYETRRQPYYLKQNLKLQRNFVRFWDRGDNFVAVGVSLFFGWTNTEIEISTDSSNNNSRP